MKDKEIFEKIYEKPGAVWTRNIPQKELIELIKKIKPCKAIDLGCGEGKNSIFLASKGFNVTAIDLSEKAIQYAKENALKAKVKVRFIAMDIFNLLKLKEKFDFVLEWGILHHIMPENRQKHIENVNKLLNKNGKYLSVCFNEQSQEYGPGKYRTTKLGTKLYYSSQDELKELFKPYFNIIESKIIKMIGGTGIGHIGNFFFMEKL